MNYELMLYLIKLNIILALLCLVFQVVMHRDTFFGVRRVMLWAIYLTAVALPLCNVQLWMQESALTRHLTFDYATYVLPSLTVTASRVATMGIEQTEPGCGMWFVGIMMLWGLIYLVPVVWLTLKLIGQVTYIIYLRCTCSPIPLPLAVKERGGYFYRYPRPCSPFSFGPWIFIHPDGMDEQTLHQVLTHELAHVRGWHTADILLSQLFCILFWWNPAVWVLRREVRLNLEFIADAAVIGQQADKREYQYRLLGFSTQMNVATIANNFNVLPLKRRIIMMNSQRTRRTGMLKYILFVPAAAAMLLLSNVDALARKSTLAVHENGANVIETKDGEDPIYDKVDELPQYAGGEQALYRYLATNVKYPAAAQEYGVQGRVLATFVVEKDGTISDIKTDKVFDPKTGLVLSEVVVTATSKDLMPEEAERARQQAEHQAEGIKAIKAETMRVLKALPERWKPGKQGGKTVRVRFTLPVLFRLQ